MFSTNNSDSKLGDQKGKGLFGGPIKFENEKGTQNIFDKKH